MTRERHSDSSPGGTPADCGRDARSPLLALICALLLAPAVLAQTEVVYDENFQAFAAASIPAGWRETSLAKPPSRRRAIAQNTNQSATYRTWIDPLNPQNVVFGTKLANDTTATLTTPVFTRPFIYTGRVLRTGEQTRVGVVVFDSNRVEPVLERNIWYYFRIEVVDTTIVARFWRDADVQNIEITGQRFDGPIGIWSAGGGEAYFDDLFARTPGSTTGVDTTPPAIRFTSPDPLQTLGSANVIVTGFADDAVDLQVDGVAAKIDSLAQTFTAGPLELGEGGNTLTATGVDAAGNSGNATTIYRVDTRAPELTVTAPAANACVDAAAIELRGTVFDASLLSGVRVNGIDARIDQRSWSASIPAANEGPYSLQIEATDAAGHRSVAALTVVVDRTEPQVDFGSDAVFFNRPAAFTIRAIDADARASVQTTLDGQPYVNGTPVAGEGAHELIATAVDCAGHRREVKRQFTIDVTAPQLLTIAPASGATVGARTQITGTVAADTASLALEPGGWVGVIDAGRFTLPGDALADGPNELEIVMTDRAGNVTRTPYRLTLNLRAPTVEIVDNGVPIPAGSLLNRPIAPVIRASDPAARITATLNGASFTSGTSISTDGAYTLAATATDALGHTSEEAARATFTIDRTAPVVKILAPLGGASIRDERVDVRGTATGGDLDVVTVNGISAVVTGESFVASLPLEAGPNLIAVVARDRAGNLAVDQIDVDRAAGPPAIILTSPPDRMVTNRRTTVVAGQVLSPAASTTVTIGGIAVPVEPTGAFRKTDVALSEGENVITAALRTTAGETNQIAVRVTADRTAPRVRLLESGQLLDDGSRFAARAVISVDATDSGQPIAAELTIDGSAATGTVTISEEGGHTILAVARDAAGNEARLERTIFVGAGGGVGCALEAFDPPAGSIVTSRSVTLVGRSGGAAGVKVNGTSALVSNGSFCATVELTAEGDNAVTIVCNDASGAATGTPAAITLRRVTNDPSISIAAPDEGAVSVAETIAVSGSAGASISSVDVNGTAATITGSTFSAAGISLAPGLNVIVARARTSGGKTVLASRRVLYLRDAPLLSITSPAAAITTGETRIDVSGMWSNLDPATIAVGPATAQTTTFSDTSGTFVVPNVTLVRGPQTVTVVGRDRTGRSVSASIAITSTAGAPSIAITDPRDNAAFPATAGDTFAVTGTFSAAAGSIVEIGGTVATISGSSFTATIPFSTVAGNTTPVVARVTEPGGAASIDTIRVVKVPARPRVLDVFPATASTAVDAGSLPLVSFSAPMDRPSLATAFRLEGASGAVVPGTMRLERDILSFAPSTLLNPGERYTLRVSTAARDIAGNAFETDFSSTFTTTEGTPSTAPTLTGIPIRICSAQIQINGTAPAGSRLRIDLGSLTFSTTATPSGTYGYTVPLSGRSGHQAVRARIAGADGSLSPAAEACFLVDCEGPQIIGAAFDRAANRLTITFSKAVKPESVTSSSIVLTLSDARVVGATTAVQSNVLTVTPSESLSQRTFTVRATTAIEDTGGAHLAFPFTQTFNYDADQPAGPGDGSGFISGEVFDSDTGRPLSGALVTVDVPPAAIGRGTGLPMGTTSVTGTTDARGRYALQLPEGSHTIAIAAPGFATSWRQITVVAGAGIVPIDVRLPKRGESRTVGPTDLIATHGPAELRVPVSSVPSGTSVTVTSLQPQALPGLLPLGWSPLRAARIDVTAASMPGAQLTLTVPGAEILAAAQVITAVQYHEDRDEWTVIAPVANIAGPGSVTIPISAGGIYALVYPDRVPHLARPPAPRSGAMLEGVTDPCAASACPPLVARSFVLDPPEIGPTGRSIATLTIEGGAPARFPSGTAVQAYIDEELRLADGSRINDPPFTTDLLLYRSLSGDAGVAQFQIAPSPKAAEVVLEVGFSRIRILPYPGRVDRGSLVGPEGGRVPGDGIATIEIPSGATPEAIRATSSSIGDVQRYGTIPGFTIAGGFTLSMQRTQQQTAPVEGMPIPAVQLLEPARATFAINAQPDRQYVLAEVLEETTHGRVFRLAAQMIPGSEGGRVTTKPIDRTTLPLDGVIREGQYLLLAADAPIAFATGAVRAQTGQYIADAHVSSGIGVTDLTRVAGQFVVPVPARPAPPFTLVPRTRLSGDGAPYTLGTSPENDAVIRIGDLMLVPQPPILTGTTPSAGASEVPLTPIIKASFSPAVAPQSITTSSIVVTDASTSQVVNGRVSAEGTSAVIWTLPPGERLKPSSRYTVAISPGILGTNGAPFGRAYTFSFSTLIPIVSGEVHREKIHITLPDATGHSRVLGESLAVPSGWNVVAMRRGRDFITRNQATAASDGSFSFTIDEVVELTDAIDLQIINTGGSIAAVIPLTPFVTEDLRGFLAPVDHDVKFASRDGIEVEVPAGSFDVPTIVKVLIEQASALADVPKFDAELNQSATIRLEFNGVAKKKLQVEVPIPPGTDTKREFLLGLRGESSRGPRVMIVDTLQVENGHFTTSFRAPHSLRSGQAPSARNLGGGLTPTTMETLTGGEAKEHLNGVNRSGIYTVVDLKSTAGGGIAWGLMDGVQAGYDLFWDTMESLYAASSYIAERGRIAIPLQRDRQFQIVGVDASTGLQAFSKVYDPLPGGDPGIGFVIPSINPDREGPYPVFGSPFRVEAVDVQVRDLEMRSVRNFVVKLFGNTIRFADDPDDALPSDVDAALLNVTRGTFDRSRHGGLFVEAERGDRVVLLAGGTEVDPSTSINVVFNEPIFTGAKPDPAEVDAYLHTVVALEKLAGKALVDISSMARFSVDSGGRRLLVAIDALERGGFYRLLLRQQLRDLAGLTIGEVAGQPALQEPVLLPFTVRAPKGALSSFDIPEGEIRDQALNGNLLFITALSGGLLAYDVSDPGGLGKNPPLARVSQTHTDFWSVASDHHGRLFTTTLTNSTGFIQTYRVGDFIQGPGEPLMFGRSFICWSPGSSTTLGVGGGTMLSDRPEGIPRKMQILIQDDEQVFPTREAFQSALSPSAVAIDAEFDDLEVTIAKSPQVPYASQRITVENMTLDLRWSADARSGAPAVIKHILARRGDRIRVMRNRATYAVVALFGYGIGVFDVNAIESNDASDLPTDYKPIRELVRMTKATLRAPDMFQTNQCTLPDTDSWAIPDLTFTPEAAIVTRPRSSSLNVFALDPHRGILDLTIVPPATEEEALLPADLMKCERAQYGLIFRGRYATPAGPAFHDHPRLAKLRDRFQALAGREPSGRFSTLSPYHYRLEAKDNFALGPPKIIGGPAPGQRGGTAGDDVERDYLLVAGHEYGLLVVEVGGTPPADIDPSYVPLVDLHLVDIIWIPAGAESVRVIPRTNLATVIDGMGHVLLVDITRIDERFNSGGNPRPTDELFASAARALASSGVYGVGLPDPRIVWRSAEKYGYGTLAPAIDPDTGLVYVSRLTEKTTTAIAAIDPRIQMKVDLGGANGLSEVGGVVPLGVAPPEEIKDVIAAASPARRPDASLAAFRLELSLPGSIADAISGNKIRLAVESERVTGGSSEQTVDPLPRAHLRSAMRNGKADPRPALQFYLRRAIPEGAAQAVRYQKGFNKFVSPWIIAIADPRASAAYQWPAGTTPQQKEEEGCFACERPVHLRGKTEANGVWEMYVNGRVIAVRPDLCAETGCAKNLFTETPYAHLGSANRLVARFSTIMADTVRPPKILVAAQNPPIAGGAVQETVYLHSGEVETMKTDLDAGGRAGWNVIFDRTYRSRTIGATSLGAGWDASMFRRLRPLPNGDVEYRDGAGEVWLYKRQLLGGHERPKGLFLNLKRTERGWQLSDQKWRMTEFDTYGRMVFEADEFAENPAVSDRGNVIRYLYDRNGRLAQIIDPAGRASTLRYYSDDLTSADAGHLREIEDWRKRRVNYFYTEGRLTRVELPDVVNTSSVRPAIRYGYAGRATIANDQLELSTNLTTVFDPGTDTPKVTLTFFADGADRDKLKREDWTATGESASFRYPSTIHTEVEDALQQRRIYTLTSPTVSYDQDRSHIVSLEEVDVPVSAIAFGKLPKAVTPSTLSRILQTRRFVFGYIGYNGEGLLTSSALEGIWKKKFDYKPVPGAPGFVLSKVTTSPDAGNPGETIETKIDYQDGPNSGSFVQSVEANGLTLSTPEPHRKNRGDVTSTNDQITLSTQYDESGLPKKVTSTGGTDKEGKGSEVEIDYVPPTGPEHSRGLVDETRRPGLQSIKRRYPNPDRVIEEDAERKVTTTTDYDTWNRRTHVLVDGPELTLEEWFEYDVVGHLAKHRRKQDPLIATTAYGYDALGRVTSTTSDNVAIGGEPKSTVTTTEYKLPKRTIVRTMPGGSVVTEELDGLGRVSSRTTSTGGAAIREEFAYDLAGNLVFSGDDHVASATAYDVHGRPIEALSADGTKSVSEYDALGHPKLTRTLDSSGTLLSESKFDFTPAGRLKSTTTNGRTTQMQWDGAGRSTSVTTGDRTMKKSFDVNGRLLSAETPLQKVTATAYDGTLVAGSVTEEKGGPAIRSTVVYDTVGNIIKQVVGPLVSTTTYDQAGNAKSAALPDRPPSQFDYDARGALTKETKPDGEAAIKHAYDAAGAVKSYVDQVGEATSSISDALGRPLQRMYPDHTSESFSYDGSRLKLNTDRQGRTFVRDYNAKGQLTDIRSGGGALLDRFEYDDAGRMIRWSTPDGVIEYGDFDMDGRPHKTTQSRLEDGKVLDSYSQTHTYNIHGERVSWTMPNSSTRIDEDRDEAGNVKQIRRDGVELMRATYRNAGRPDERVVGPIVRKYGYNAETGQLNSLEVSSHGIIVAGSAVTHDGLQIQRAQLLGFAGGARANEYTYDAMSRLRTASFAREPGAPAAVETLTPADVRRALDRPVTSPSDPPSVTFGEGPGHKLTEVERNGVKRKITYTGAERVDDGDFTYEFDPRGRLVSINSTARRVRFFYSGTDRIIGRRAEYSTSSGWKLEDRGPMLDSDGLPADTTFVWDPISDQLVSVFAPGGGAPLRQYIHGGNGYDDPIEITVGDRRLYPIFDEAATGNLQVILDAEGQIVARALLDGPYGEDQSTLAGMAIDRITVRARKTAQGTLDFVEIDLHVTEEIDPTTLPTGAHLTPALVEPKLVDGYTIRWTLNAADWSRLTSSATLSVAVTEALRARAWSASTPVLPPPEWALRTKPVSTSAATPFAYRESTSSLTSWLATLPPAEEATTTLYKLDNLAGIGQPLGLATAARPERLILTSPFQALPFAEPITGLIYARSRWLDPSSGTFMSPDAQGYGDSSNLYAFASSDPINRRDPTGDITIVLHGTNADTAQWATSEGAFAQAIDQHTGDVYKIEVAPGLRKHVSALPAFAKFSHPNRPRGELWWHSWNWKSDRHAGAQRLAEYIGTIKRYYPNERINVVTHSHGGNVATMATALGAKIDTLVVLGKPYMYSGDERLAQRSRSLYAPNRKNIREPILNIYSTEDGVQLPGAHVTASDEGPNRWGSRYEVVPALADAYINVDVKTEVGSFHAHGVLHSAAMGHAVGDYLASSGTSAAAFQAAMKRQRVPVPIIAKEKGD